MKVISPRQIDFRGGLSLTRASKATYIDANGNWIDAAINEVRFHHYEDDEGNFHFESILIEPERNNYIKSTGTTGAGLAYPDNMALKSSQTVTFPSGTVAVVLSFYGTGILRITSTSVGAPAFTKDIKGTGNNVRTYFTIPVAESYRQYNIAFIGSVYESVFAVNAEPLTSSDVDGVVNRGGPNSEVYHQFCRPTSWIPTGLTVPVNRKADIVSTSGIFSGFGVDFQTDPNYPDYSPTTTYNLGDRVNYGSFVFKSLIAANVGNTPDTNPTKWEKVRVETYASGTTYGLAARVLYNEIIYESLEAGNIGNQPDISPTKWIRVKVNNEFAMVDLETGSSSTNNGTVLLLLHLKDEYYDSAGFMELNAQNIDVSIARYSSYGWDVERKYFTDYQRNVTIVGANLHGAVNNTKPKGTIVCFRLAPPASTPTQEVSISEMIVGNYSQIGTTQYGLTAGITDYSIKETNEFGYTDFVRRGYSKKISAQVFIDNDDLNYALRNLYDLRAQPTLWVFSDEDKYSNAAVVFGYYKDFSVVIPYPTSSMCSIEIEGLVI